MTTTPPWAQPGITDVPAATAFLAALRARDTLVLHAADADVGYPISRRSQAFRGHCAAVSPNVVAATPPAAELVAYHRSLGLGPEHVVCPSAPSARAPLARLLLDDGHALGRLVAAGDVTRMFVAFKDGAAASLLTRFGLEPVYSAPAPEAYERANDKLEFARAGARYGFDTLPMEVVADDRQLAEVFATFGATWGEGCMLRLRRGAGGHHLTHARTLAQARRAWRRFRRRGDVLVTPFVPPAHVLRNVATHGLVGDDGFAPLAFSEQVIHRGRFRGGRVAPDWQPAEIAAVRTTLAGVARWLRDVGYRGAPAGVDGFLLRDGAGLRFVAIDPNARLTGTMMPWTVAATLAEAAGRAFVWQVEYFPTIGPPLGWARLVRTIGDVLVDPRDVARGGIVPSFVGTRRVGPIAASGLWAVLLADDVPHLERLRARIRALGWIAR